MMLNEAIMSNFVILLDAQKLLFSSRAKIIKSRAIKL